MRDTAKLCLALLLIPFLAAATPPKPKIQVAKDGFPTGQTTPEGAATDLARSFMTHNATLFRTVCIPPFGSRQSSAGYAAYLDGVAAHFGQVKALSTASPDDPRKILKVFAARHLGKEGPASYGYATYDFRDVMFVDLEVLLHSGRKLLRRTMVIQNSDGKWYTLPVPDTAPLLSYGIYEESASVRSFSDVYDVEK